ncbi:MAG: flagellar motor protein [Pseudomonadales bacterium]|nr:flagellar motor protein [Pseudomonadales bacterium]
MDIVAILGIVLAFGAIVFGNFLEGGEIDALLNTPAGVIVLGGTIGAIVLQTPWPGLKRALQLLKWIFVPPVYVVNDGIKKIRTWSVAARKDGLLGLEEILAKEKDEFACKGLELLIDGGTPQIIRQVLEGDLSLRLERDIAGARVFKSMGGYAPTIGIIGAVMGLIQVMSNLADPSALGDGIAVAFIATIYGVGLANLLFLPVADRLVSLVNNEANYRAMTIEGILALAEGEHPRFIELRLKSFMDS